MTAYLDHKRVRRAFDRAAQDFDAKDFLNREIRERLSARLDLVAIEPKTVVDLGAGTADGTRLLQARYPSAHVTAIDSALEMLKVGARSACDENALCADAVALPLRDASIDLVFSNLMLPFCADPLRTLAEARRVLRHPGAFLFTSLGPDTLSELQRAWQSADRFHHVLPFMDMHDLGDAVVHAGFAEPVLDTEILTVTYRDLDRALADLRGAGSINASIGRNPGLTGRAAWQRMADAYESIRSADGLLPGTIEVVFVLAWAGDSAGRRRRDGAVEVPVDQLLRRAKI